MEKIGAVKNSLWKDDGSLVNTVCSSCLLYCTHKHMEPCDSDGQVGMAVFWINTMQHPLCMASRAQGLKFPSLNLYWEFSNPKWVALNFKDLAKIIHFWKRSVFSRYERWEENLVLPIFEWIMMWGRVVFFPSLELSLCTGSLELPARTRGSIPLSVCFLNFLQNWPCCSPRESKLCCWAICFPVMFCRE